MFAMYAQKFLSMTSNQLYQERGNYVLYGAHVLAFGLIIVAAVVISLGHSMVYPLIGGIVCITTASVIFLLYAGHMVHKQLLDSKSKIAGDVASFLKKWAQIAAMCLVVFVITALAAIMLGESFPARSTSSCAVMQVIHSILEAVLLGSWVRHVKQVQAKLDVSRLSRLNVNSVPGGSSTDRRDTKASTTRAIQVDKAPSSPAPSLPSEGNDEKKRGVPLIELTGDRDLEIGVAVTPLPNSQENMEATVAPLDHSIPPVPQVVAELSGSRKSSITA
jgi:hypothetical protein